MIHRKKTNLIEDILQTLLCQRRTLYVLHASLLLRPPLSLQLRDRLLLHPPELFLHGRVVAQIFLCADEDDGDAGTVVLHLGDPLLADILERRVRRDAEAHQEDVCLRVGQRSQSVVIFLTGCVEQTECVRVVADHHCDCVVVEHL